MRPTFISVRTRDGNDIAVNANAIIYYHLIGLGPGLGTKLFFSGEHSIETIHDSIELEIRIREAIDANDEPLPKRYYENRG